MNGNGRCSRRFNQGPHGAASRHLEVAISCRNLANKDFLSKSDPFVVVYQARPGERTLNKDDEPVWTRVQLTETIDNDLNPDFTTRFVFPINSHDDEQTKLRFDVYDRDNDLALDRQDFIGQAQCLLGELLSAAVLSITLASRTWKESRRRGMIILFGEPIPAFPHPPASLPDANTTVEDLTFTLGLRRSTNLEKRETYFFAISRQAPRGHRLYSRVYRSAKKPGAQLLDGQFPSISMTGQELCNDDESRPFRIELYRDNRGLAARRVEYCLLGFVEASVADIRKANQSGSLRFEPATGGGVSFGEMELEALRWRPGGGSILSVKLANFIFSR